MTGFRVDAGSGDEEPGDGLEVAAGPDGDLLITVQDPQMSVFDDDGDQLAAVARAEFDALAGDENPAAVVDPPLGA